MPGGIGCTMSTFAVPTPSSTAAIPRVVATKSIGAAVAGGANLIQAARCAAFFCCATVAHRTSSTGILQDRIISLVVEPIMSLRMREWPYAPMTSRSIPPAITSVAITLSAIPGS